ncbi:MAG: flavodoxin domain-containing protein [Candidatus Bathyarchaeota archaeon]|nr:flavodoxin domain-containing protein [Candidatus Bathyarchaeota archaeon]
MKRAVVLYWSNTGNTKKVADAIKEGLESAGLAVSLKKTTEAYDIDYFDYDLVCVGAPSIQWHPPKQVTEFLLKKFDDYRKQGKIKTGAPKVEGKNALVFCTYSGPHTGLNEATPVGKYIGQFFEHLGFTVLDEWYVLSEFIGSEERSTQGRMGDIRGKPTKQELQKIVEDAKILASKL